MKITTIFNDYFAEPIPSLNLFKRLGNVTGLAKNLDIIHSMVLKFHNHPSIKIIKNKFRKITKFSRKAIKDIPPDIIKQSDLCFQALMNCINQSTIVESITETC